MIAIHNFHSLISCIFPRPHRQGIQKVCGWSFPVDHPIFEASSVERHLLGPNLGCSAKMLHCNRN